MSVRRRAEVLLLSGGVDSIALAYGRRPKLALTVDYGQRAAKAEIAAARGVCEYLEIAHCVIRAPLRALGQGVMVGRAALPRASTPAWWPFRNQLLITLGGMLAIREGLSAVVIGTVAGDSRHRDGSSAFLKRIDRLMVSQEGAIRVIAPASGMDGEALVRRFRVPRAVLGYAHSCNRSVVPCGRCGSCERLQQVIQQGSLRRG